MSAESLWYYAVAGRQEGPVALPALQQLLASGKLRPVDLVWNPSMTQWAPAASITALMGHANVGVVNTAMQQGYMPHAAAHAAAHLTSGYADQRYAGFWLRASAALIDAALVLVVTVAFVLVGSLAYVRITHRQNMDVSDAAVDATLVLFVIFINGIYKAWMESSRTQASLGKMAVGLYVTDDYGRRISFTRATMRYFAKLLSAIPLGLGFLMVAVTDRRRALHDMLASTLVQRRH